jgi:antitoxin MazE
VDTKAQMSKWGNSLAIRIPKEVAEKAALREGDVLILEVEAKGAIAMKVESSLPSLKQLVSAITRENIHSETDWGEPVGNEQW